MTRTISVVTAAYRPVPEYLLTAYESLAAQGMPDGWAWQWVIQEDDQAGEVERILPPGDDRISVAGGRHSGASIARTMCLARATGELVKVLDADDVLTPGALARDIAVLEGHPEVGWATSRVLDLLPDGSMTGFDDDPPPGVIEAGSLLDHWREHDYRPRVHPVTLCARRCLVVMLGGWMPLPASGDTGLLLALSAVSAGYFIGDPGLLYRKWPGQATAQPGYNEPAERAARMRIIEARAIALAALRQQHQPVTSPLP